VLFWIADINKHLSSFAIFRSDIDLGIMLRQSISLLVSTFHSLMFSPEAANKRSELLSSSNTILVIAELSTGVTLIFTNCSKSQYLTVLSVEPLARARFCGLN
jgi:hypothetical protein